MKKILYSILLLLLIGCNKETNLNGTTWIFSSEEGTSTLIFSDSTYVCMIKYNETIESDSGVYRYNHPNLEMTMNGKTLDAYVDRDKLITKDEYVITFEKQ